MPNLKNKLKKLFTLFENKTIRNRFLVFSIVIHALAGVLLFKISNNVPYFAWPSIAAGLSIVPLILFAENLKKLILYLFLAVSPVPIFITVLLLAVQILEIVNKGANGFSLDGLGTLVTIPFMLSAIMLTIVWHIYVYAFIIKLVIWIWLKKFSTS